LRALRKNTERELRYVEKRGAKANDRRVRGAVAGLKGGSAILHARLRGVQADLHAIELEAVHRRHNAARYPDAFEPPLPDVPDDLPPSDPLETPRVSPLPYGDGHHAPFTVEGAEAAETKKPTIASISIDAAGIADTRDYAADDDAPRRNGRVSDQNHDGSPAEPGGA
jgi:hypothetical protein